MGFVQEIQSFLQQQKHCKNKPSVKTVQNKCSFQKFVNIRTVLDYHDVYKVLKKKMFWTPLIYHVFWFNVWQSTKPCLCSKLQIFETSWHMLRVLPQLSPLDLLYLLIPLLRLRVINHLFGKILDMVKMKQEGWNVAILLASDRVSWKVAISYMKRPLLILKR